MVYFKLLLISTAMIFVIFSVIFQVIATTSQDDVFPVPIDYPGIKESLAFLGNYYETHTSRNDLEAAFVKALAEVCIILTHFVCVKRYLLNKI